jgi:hypothetical protein
MVIDHETNVPELDALLSSNTFNDHMPFGFPVSVLNAFSGLKLPVNGADPEEMGLAAASEKTVLVKLLENPPLSATRAIDWQNFRLLKLIVILRDGSGMLQLDHHHHV